MKWLLNLVERLADGARRREQMRYEAYLADASDLYDLEHRQRSWDRQQSDQRGLMFVDRFR